MSAVVVAVRRAVLDVTGILGLRRSSLVENRDFRSVLLEWDKASIDQKKKEEEEAFEAEMRGGSGRRGSK